MYFLCHKMEMKIYLFFNNTEGRSVSLKTNLAIREFNARDWHEYLGLVGRLGSRMILNVT